MSSGLVVNFKQTSDSIDTDVTVTPSSDTAATVAVPAAVYNSVTAGNAVSIKVTNTDGQTSGTVNKTATSLPTGGTITTSGGYRIHTFNTGSSNFVNTLDENPKLVKKVLKNGSTDKNKKSEIMAKQKFILSITKNGFGKRTSFYDYRVTNRGGKGIIGIVNSSRNGDVAASFPVNEGDIKRVSLGHLRKEEPIEFFSKII